MTGVFELRYFSGLGFNRLEAISGPIVIVDSMLPHLQWIPLFPAQNLALAAFSAGKLVAMSSSKELCSGALPRNVSTLQGPVRAARILDGFLVLHVGVCVCVRVRVCLCCGRRRLSNRYHQHRPRQHQQHLPAGHAISKQMSKGKHCVNVSSRLLQWY